ncbi:MAG: hypothetical protein ACREBI_10685 [Nitrosotalea sp.]
MKNLFLLALLGITLLAVQHAYGDGFTQEVMPPASVEGKKVTLFVKINPPVITSENNQDRYLFFRWFDANNNQTIQHTTFLLVVTKHDMPLMQAILHTHTGVLTLKITPSNDPKRWAINGTEEPFLDGVMWLPFGDKPLDVTAPILGEGGLYHIYTLLATIDSDDNIFSPQDAPKFDSYLSVGDVSNHTVTYDDMPYNVTLISYYDKTANFGFDSSKMTVSWSMPFDWNTTRLANNPIFVHQELRVPKSFGKFASSPSFDATVNGVAVSEKELVADPYSIDNYTTLHILLNKGDLATLAKTVAENGTMNFAISPGIENTTTSTSMLTDFGGWQVNLGWASNLQQDSQAPLKISFFDAFSEQRVSGDVSYDFKMLDRDGNTILSKTGLVARNGTDIQQVALPSNGIYDIEVGVKSVSTSGFTDTSRTGLARGNLVIPSTITQTVPEFGPVHFIAIIGMACAVALTMRLSFRSN